MLKIKKNQFDSPLTLEDNLIGDITFESFGRENIKKFGWNAFNKIAHRIKLLGILFWY